MLGTLYEGFSFWQDGTRDAAVNGEALPGDPRAFVAREKQCAPGYIDGLTNSAQRMHALPVPAQFRWIGNTGKHTHIHRSLNRSGRDAVHANVIFGVLACQLSGQADDSTFAGRVVRIAREAKQSLHGGDIYDGAALTCQHSRQDVLRAQKHAGQIDVDDVIPIGQVETVCRGFMGDAGYIREHINRLPEVFLCFGDSALHFTFDAHIGAAKDALPSGASNLFRGSGSGLGVDIGRNDLGTVLREEQRNAFSNSHRGTGDQRDTPSETHNPPWL